MKFHDCGLSAWSENREIACFQFCCFVLAEINNIIKYRCGVCHTKNPTTEGIDSPPKGFIFDSAQDILNNLSIIQAQAIDSDSMPPGNMTGITQQERDKLLLWIQQGADINK